jgi:hypothetical protein
MLAVLYEGQVRGAPVDAAFEAAVFRQSSGGRKDKGKPGKLSVEGTRVNYVEVRDVTQNFSMDCNDFPAASGDDRAAGIHIQTSRKHYTLWAEDYFRVYKGVLDACISAKVTSSPHEARAAVMFHVNNEQGFRGHAGILSVEGSQVIYFGFHTFSVPCADFLGRVTINGFLEIVLAESYSLNMSEGVGRTYSEIAEACAVAREREAAEKEREAAEYAATKPLRDAKEAEERAARLAEEAKRQADEAERQAALEANFRYILLRAWGAADEPDPFASIRGEFDLKNSDNRHWSTTLTVPGANRCFLIRTPGASPVSPLWTYTCEFRGSTGEYESYVKSVQRVLGLAYQPDDSVAEVNQVVFSDKSRPNWRLLLTNITAGATVLLRITPRQAGAGLPGLSGAGTGKAAGSAPAPLSIPEEIERIRSGSHSAMPPAQRSAPSGFGGRTTMTVNNSTRYTLSVYFDGPVAKSLSIAPNASQTVELTAGAFYVAGRVDTVDVLPFYGEEKYDGSMQYIVTFYIGPQ